MCIHGGINHITLRVQSLQRSEKFYTGVLGLKRVGERTGMHFYSSGRYHHELALVEDPGLSPGNLQRAGLVHIGFNVENMQKLGTLYQTIIDAGFPVSSGVDHTISRSFYTRDPDGYILELTTDCPRHEWQPDPGAFERDQLFDL